MNFPEFSRSVSRSIAPISGGIIEKKQKEAEMRFSQEQMAKKREEDRLEREAERAYNDSLRARRMKEDADLLSAKSKADTDALIAQINPQSAGFQSVPTPQEQSMEDIIPIVRGLGYAGDLRSATDIIQERLKPPKIEKPVVPSPMWTNPAEVADWQMRNDGSPFPGIAYRPPKTEKPAKATNYESMARIQAKIDEEENNLISLKDMTTEEAKKAGITEERWNILVNQAESRINILRKALAGSQQNAEPTGEDTPDLDNIFNEAGL